MATGEFELSITLLFQLMEVPQFESASVAMKVVASPVSLRP